MVQLTKTWRDVSERDRCMVGTQQDKVPHKPAVQEKYTPGVWPWCFRREPGCKTITINRDCLTRSQHMELLATPKGYTWTGLRGLSEVMERCGEPSPYGDHNATRPDNLNEDEYGVKKASEALKKQNKSSLPKTGFKGNKPSKDLTYNGAKKSKTDQKDQKLISKLKSDQKLNGQKTTKNLRSGQKQKEDGNTKALNGGTSSEMRRKNAMKSKQGQPDKKEKASKTTAKDSKSQQKSANNLTHQLKEDNVLASLASQGDTSSKGQKVKNGTSKTGVGVTSSKTQDQTLATTTTDQLKDTNTRDYDFKIPKKPQRKGKKRFVFERPNTDKVTKETRDTHSKSETGPCSGKKEPATTPCANRKPLQFEKNTETEVQGSCFEKPARPAQWITHMVNQGCTTNVAVNKDSNSNTCNHCILYQIRKADGSNYVYNKVTDPPCNYPRKYQKCCRKCQR